MNVRSRARWRGVVGNGNRGWGREVMSDDGPRARERGGKEG